jgi:hypothetical protein
MIRTLGMRLPQAFRRTVVLLIVLVLGVLALTRGPHGPEVLAKDEEESAKKAGLPAALALVPPDAIGFFHLRVADLWKSDLGKRYRTRFPREADGLEKGIKKALSLSPANIESCTTLYPSSGPWFFFTGMGRAEKDVIRGEKNEKPVDSSKKKEPDSKEEKKEEKPDAQQPVQVSALASHHTDELNDVALGPPPLIITTVKPYDRDAVLEAIAPNGQKFTYKGKTYYSKAPKSSFAWGVYFVGKRTFVIGPLGRLRQLVDNIVSGESRGPLHRALRLAAEKHLLAGGMQLVAKEGKKIRDNWTEMLLGQSKFGAVGRALQPLLQMETAAFTVDLNGELRANARLDFTDEKRSKKAVGAVDDALALLRIFGIGSLESSIQFALEELDESKAQETAMWQMLLAKKFGSAVRGAQVERNGKTVRIAVRAKINAQALDEQAKVALKAWKSDTRIMDAIRRTKVKNDLRQIGLAMHNYNDTYKFLPAASFQGEPALPTKNFHRGLSWRVAILPFIEQQELYRKFKLDEPWDSEHNKKLLKYMPKIFAPPRGVKSNVPFGTFYQVFVGNGAAFEPKENASIPRTFPDGTANTILIVEASKAVPWTKPEDIPYDPKKPLPKLGAAFENGFFVLMGDASTRFVKNSISKETLHAAITRAGGEVLGSDWE